MKPSLSRAITLIKAGQRDSARTQLARLLRADPANGRAWLWLATVTDDPQRRRFCVQQALDLDPTDPQARRLWEQLFWRPLPPLPAGEVQEPLPLPAETQLLPAIASTTGRWRSPALRLTGLLLLLLGGVTLLLGLLPLANQRWIAAASVVVEGEVVSLDSTVGSGLGRRHTLVYRFPTGDRLTVGEAALPRALWVDLARGDAVRVQYDPADPDQSLPRVGPWGLGSLLPALGQIVLGLLLIGAGLFATRRA